jgi:proline iminopeptidase
MVTIGAMPTFLAPDGTRLAYYVDGDGPLLVCLPGGPMRASRYLGDLGGLPARLRVVRLDLRGTGDSATPADPASYRCDRLVGDVEALREQLGVDQVDLLGHSAGANLAMLYASEHPGRVRRLLLVTPSTRAVGIEVTADARRELIALRAGEPPHAEASAAFERVAAGESTDADWGAMAPFFYGRWDEQAQAHSAAGADEVNEEAQEEHIADGAFRPDATKAALAGFDRPVFVLAGELDLNTVPRAAAELAALFPAGELYVQPGAGHYPWLDDADLFASVVTGFLAGAGRTSP